MSTKYKLKFMFDWGSGVCLWSANEAAENKFGDYPIACSDIPISQSLREKLEALIDKHDEAFNWNDPAGDLLWDDKQVTEFLTEARNLHMTLCEELPDDYDIEFVDHM